VIGVENTSRTPGFTLSLQAIACDPMLEKEVSMETATVKMFTVEYEWQGRVWNTVVEGYDRENAKEHFIAENPYVRFIRACDENEVSNNALHVQPGREK
jgi:hypothetical protein